jgi:glycosyltransferase involved in cell wall biosynthesis
MSPRASDLLGYEPHRQTVSVAHLLFVTYYYPPAGGALVRRALRFLRYLPEHGFRCTALTADHPYDLFHPDDPDELRHMPKVNRTVRAPARAGLERLLAAGYRSLQRKGRPSSGAEARPSLAEQVRPLLYETVALPDPKWPWIRGAVREALRVAQDDLFDVVLATGYPWSAFLVAEKVAGALGVPYVLDYRDGWTVNPRGHWTGRRNRALEGRLLAGASAVVTATEGFRESILQAFPQVKTRLRTILNGYDPQEQPPPDPELSDPRRLVITYTGTFGFEDSHCWRHRKRLPRLGSQARS